MFFFELAIGNSNNFSWDDHMKINESSQQAIKIQSNIFDILLCTTFGAH